MGVYSTDARAREGLSQRAKTAKESEKTIEARLVVEVRRLGGIALKHSSQFHRGMPDRIVLLPGGLTFFVELKSSGEKPTVLQTVAHARLRTLGYTVIVIDSTESLVQFITRAKALIRK